MNSTTALIASAFPYNDWLRSGLNGIDGTVLPVIQFIAGAILTVSFLWGIYDAFVNGGELRSVGLSFLKYACVTFVVFSWGTVFRDVNACFDYASSSISGTSGLDEWATGLKLIWNNTSFTSLWNLIIGAPAALISSVLLILGFLIFPIGLCVFILCYVFWGCILYALGPLVLALMPSSTLGVFHRRWIESLFVWNCWGLLASLFMALMTAIGLGSPAAVQSSGSFMGALSGADQMMVISIASVLIAATVATIPLTARAILLGEFSPVGAVLFFMARSATKMIQTAGRHAAGGPAVVSGGGGGSTASSPSAGGASPLVPAFASGGGGGSTLGPPPDTPPPSGTTRFFPVYR